MARGKIGTPEEEQREATAAQNQADNVLSTAVVDTFKALAAQEHADNEAAEAEAAEGWDKANKERKKAGLDPVKKTREQTRNEKFEQKQADWNKQREHADWYEKEQHSFDAWRNQQNKEELEKQEAAEHAKNNETLQKVGKYGEMKYRKAPDKTVTGKGLEKSTEKKSAPKFSDAGDVSNMSVTKSSAAPSTSTGPRPGEQYKDVNEGKAGYEDWQQRHADRMAELKAKMDKKLSDMRNGELASRYATRAKNLEEARKVVSSKANADNADIYNNDDKFESSLTSANLDDMTNNILKAFGYTDRAKRAAGASAEPEKEEKSFDSLKEIKTPKGKFEQGINKPADYVPSMGEFEDLLERAGNLIEDNTYVPSVYENIDDLLNAGDKEALNKYLAKEYNHLSSIMNNATKVDSNEAKELFKNKDVRSRGAGLSLYTGNTLEGKKLSERGAKKLIDDYKTEQEGFKANEALNIKQRARMQSLYAKMKNSTDAAIQKLLDSGMDEDNPRIQRLRKSSEDLQSKMDAAAQSSAYSDPELAGAVSDYNNFLRAMTKGQYSALGDLSRFGALGLTSDDIEKKFPLKRYLELLNTAKNLWPRQDPQTYNESLQKLLDEGMDLTEAKHKLNRDNSRGKVGWVNKQLGPLYRALGGTEDDAVPYYIDELVAKGMDPEAARHEVINEEAKQLERRLAAVGEDTLYKGINDADKLSAYYGDSGEQKVKDAAGKPEVISRRVLDASEAPDNAKAMDKIERMKTGGSAPAYELDTNSDEYKQAVRYFANDTAEHNENAIKYAGTIVNKLPDTIMPAVDALINGTSREELEKEIKFQQDRIASSDRAMNTYMDSDPERYAKAEQRHLDAIRRLEEAKSMLESAPEDPQADIIAFAKSVAQEAGDNPMQFDLNLHERINPALHAENYANAKAHALESAMEYLAKYYNNGQVDLDIPESAPLNPDVLSALIGDVSGYYKDKYGLK